MQFPAQNTQINSVSGLTTEASKSIFPSTSAELSATGSYMVGSKSHGSSSVGLADKKTLTTEPDSIFVSEPIGDGQNYSMNLRLGNTEIIPVSAVVTIILRNCIMPPTLATLSGFYITSQD